VGRPVVVNPDPLLKRHASDYHWPVLNVADGA
jgi:phosphoserine phosphatase